MKLSALGDICKKVRSRITLLFLFTAACWVVFTVLIWFFELFDDATRRILLSVVVAMVPLGVYFSQKTWELTEDVLWLMASLAVVLLLTLSDKFNWFFLESNAILLLIALPYGWVVWKLMRRNWLLLTGLALALGVMMIYWIAALMKGPDSLDYLLAPLPVVLSVGVPWTPLARWSLNEAERRKFQRVHGPGMQALAMAALFLPAIVVAIVFPGALELGQAWSSVSLTLVSVLLSAVVADPLRRCLLEWANLNPNSAP